MKILISAPLLANAGLTPSELVAYALSAQGQSAMEIAEHLNVHGYQVKQNLESAFRKVINSAVKGAKV